MEIWRERSRPRGRAERTLFGTGNGVRVSFGSTGKISVLLHGGKSVVPTGLAWLPSVPGVKRRATLARFLRDRDNNSHLPRAKTPGPHLNTALGGCWFLLLSFPEPNERHPPQHTAGFYGRRGQRFWRRHYRSETLGPLLPALLRCVGSGLHAGYFYCGDGSREPGIARQKRCLSDSTGLPSHPFLRAHGYAALPFWRRDSP